MGMIKANWNTFKMADNRLKPTLRAKNFLYGGRNLCNIVINCFMRLGYYMDTGLAYNSNSSAVSIETVIKSPVESEEASLTEMSTS